MATPVTGIRIPADLLALIDARAIDGKTRTDIVIWDLMFGKISRCPGLSLKPPACSSSVPTTRAITPLAQLTENFFDLLVGHSGKMFEQQPMDKDVATANSLKEEMLYCLVEKTSIVPGYVSLPTENEA